MELREHLEALAPRCGELQAHDPVVLWVTDPLYQTRRDGPVHQTDRAVVPEEEVVRHLPDSGAAAVAVPPYGEQQLVLRRCQSCRIRLLLAPSHQPPKAGAQGQEIFEIGIPQTHRLTIASYCDKDGEGSGARQAGLVAPTKRRLPKRAPTVAGKASARTSAPV